MKMNRIEDIGSVFLPETTVIEMALNGTILPSEEDERLVKSIQSFLSVTSMLLL